ncbi:MAG: recombinase family protein [Rhizobiaceae bacterium]|nr:recombinase family protein [Rhizobiaceae bacterium]
MTQYIVYKRVSSKEQGNSGLGLEAQDRDIELFLANYADKPEVIGRFQDVQSGADDSRPALNEALALARRTGAELLVSKLDRLSRKVSFIATIMDDRKVRLRVASMPFADNFQLHVYAALAEQERAFISARTRAALSVAKARGVKLGGLRPGTKERAAAIAAKAKADADRLIKVVKPLRDADQSLSAIAEALDRMNIPTSRGGRWSAMQVSRILQRATTV